MKYQKSELMKQIGNQSFGKFDKEGQLIKDFYEIMTANKLPEFLQHYEEIQLMVVDVFLYGTMLGREEERKRQKKCRIKSEGNYGKH